MSALDRYLDIVNYKLKRKAEIKAYLLQTQANTSEGLKEQWRLLQKEEETSAQLRKSISDLQQQKIKAASDTLDAVMGARGMMESQTIAAEGGVARAKEDTRGKIAQSRYSSADEARKDVDAKEQSALRAAGAMLKEIDAGTPVRPGDDPSGVVDALIQNTLAPLTASMVDSHQKLVAANEFERMTTAALVGKGIPAGVAKAAVRTQMQTRLGMSPSAWSTEGLAQDKEIELQTALQETRDFAEKGLPGGVQTQFSPSLTASQMAGPESISRAAKIGVPESKLPEVELRAALAKLQLTDPKAVEGVVDIRTFADRAKNDPKIADAIAEMQSAPWDVVASYSNPDIVAQLEVLRAHDEGLAAKKLELQSKLDKPVDYRQLEDQARIMYVDLYGTDRQRAALTKIRSENGIRPTFAALAAEVGKASDSETQTPAVAATASPPTTPTPEAASASPTAPAVSKTGKTPAPAEPTGATPPVEETPTIGASLPAPEATDVSSPPVVEATAVEVAPAAMDEATPEDISFDAPAAEEITIETPTAVDTALRILKSPTKYDDLDAGEREQLDGAVRDITQQITDLNAEAQAAEGQAKLVPVEKMQKLSSILMLLMAKNPDKFAGIPNTDPEIQKVLKTFSAQTPSEVAAQRWQEGASDGLQLATSLAKSKVPESPGEWKTELAKVDGKSVLTPQEIVQIIDYARRRKVPSDPQQIQAELSSLIPTSRWVKSGVEDQVYILFTAARSLAQSGQLPVPGR